MEPVSWAAVSAPSAAYTDVLAILNNCPEHDMGILFAYLADIQPDPYYGMRVVDDGQEGPKGLYLAALIACNTKSKTDQVGDGGYKVVTSDLRHAAFDDDDDDDVDSDDEFEGDFDASDSDTGSLPDLVGLGSVNSSVMSLPGLVSVDNPDRDMGFYWNLLKRPSAPEP